MIVVVKLKAPFPWMGGKSTVAELVWQRFGNVRNFVEPFFGSGAVLLGRAQPFDGTETVNDADGFVSNFWRAVSKDAAAVAEHADWPVNENDLHARHIWLVNRRADITATLEGDPEWFDAKVAGWWCWGLCCWIGGGWCAGQGPWQSVEMEDGSRQLVHLGNAGRGVNRKRVHLGNAGRGVNRKRVHLGDAGRGVNRQRVHLGNAGFGVNRVGITRLSGGIYDWMEALGERLARVRVCCGDWLRVCGPTPTIKQGLTAVFLDPPYSTEAGRDMDLYAVDCGKVAHAAREWAIAHGDDPQMRIALCGYEGEHMMPDSWECLAWKAQGGYANQSDKENVNATRERLWFSPHCLKVELPLFQGIQGSFH